MNDSCLCWEGEKIYCILAITVQGPVKVFLVQSLNLQKTKLRPREGKCFVQGRTEAESGPRPSHGDSSIQKQKHCRQGTKQVQRPRGWPVPIMPFSTQTSPSLVYSVSEVFVPACNYLLYGAASFFYAPSLGRQGPDCVPCMAQSSQGVTAE